MTTVIVQFALPAGMTLAQAGEAIAASAPLFRGVPGLLRKYYLLSMEAGTWGGIYIWASREEAERFYAAGFRAMVRERYGSEPSVTFFDLPAVVDNPTGPAAHSRHEVGVPCLC